MKNKRTRSRHLEMDGMEHSMQNNSYFAFYTMSLMPGNNKFNVWETFQSSLALPTNPDFNYSSLISRSMEEKDYRTVTSLLKHGFDPNEEIPFPNVYMTGLEYAVYQRDYKMALIFFVHGADPSYSCFDGNFSLGNNRSLASDHLKHTRFIDNFSALHNGGSNFDLCFKHLIKLSKLKGAHKDLERTMSTIWIIHFCTDISNFVMTPESLMNARKCLVDIGAGYVWNKYFLPKVKTSLACLNQVSMKNNSRGLPNDISLKIIDYLIDDLLLGTIQFAVKQEVN